MTAFVQVPVRTYFSTHTVWAINFAASKTAKKAAWRLIARGKHPQSHNDGEPDYAGWLESANRRGVALWRVKEDAQERVLRSRRLRKLATDRSERNAAMRAALAAYAEFPRVARALASPVSLHDGALLAIVRRALAGDTSDMAWLAS